MVDIVDGKTFYSNTFGGRPCQAQMYTYEGILYKCGCGMSHSFSEQTIAVIRELPGMKFVFVAECEYSTLIKIKGIFSVNFVSIMSCSKEEVDKLTQEDIAEIFASKI